jgi:hypothetical protein
MNRRSFTLAAVAGSFAVIAGCDGDSKPSHTATMLDNEDVHLAMSAVDDALANLEGNVDNFDSEGWRDVVPEVKACAGELRSAVESLRRALGYPQ